MADTLSRAKLARAAQRLNRQSGCWLPPLALMTDDERLPDPLAAAAALPRGSLIVLRARSPEQRAATAQALLPIVRARNLRLLIANDPPLAQRIGADGIHLSERRRGEALHWRALQPHWIFTAAAHSLAACASAKACGAEAAFLSPVFATHSHPGAPHLGVARALLIARHAPLPVYALGGIEAANIESLRDSSFAGVAAIGALRV